MKKRRDFKVSALAIIMKFKKNALKVDDASSTKSLLEFNKILNDYQLLKKEKEAFEKEFSRMRLESQDLNARCEELQKIKTFQSGVSIENIHSVQNLDESAPKGGATPPEADILNQKLAAATRDNELLKSAIAERQSKLESLGREVDALKQQISKANEDHAAESRALNTIAEQNIQRFEEANALIHELKQDNEALEANLGTSEDKLKNIQAQLEKSSNEISRLMKELEQAKDQHKRQTRTSIFGDETAVVFAENEQLKKRVKILESKLSDKIGGRAKDAEALESRVRELERLKGDQDQQHLRELKAVEERVRAEERESYILLEDKFLNNANKIMRLFDLIQNISLSEEQKMTLEDLIKS